MKIYKLDSIEDGVAAVEDPCGIMLYFKADRLPENSKDGDCFVFENGKFVLCQEETEKRRTAVSSLLDGLVNKQ